MSWFHDLSRGQYACAARFCAGHLQESVNGLSSCLVEMWSTWISLSVSQIARAASCMLVAPNKVGCEECCVDILRELESTPLLECQKYPGELSEFPLGTT